MGEYQVKLEALEEYRKALLFKKGYEDILEAFQGLPREFIDYCERNGMEIPERETYLRVLQQATRLIEGRVPTALKQPNETTDDDDTTKICGKRLLRV